jgi:hypothetical protein
MPQAWRPLGAHCQRRRWCSRRQPQRPAVTSETVAAGTTAASKADRAGTSAPPTAGAEGGDLGTSGLQVAPGPLGIMEEGTRSVNDED